VLKAPVKEASPTYAELNSKKRVKGISGQTRDPLPLFIVPVTAVDAFVVVCCEIPFFSALRRLTSVIGMNYLLLFLAWPCST
jgi:hypothetical protein